MTAPTLADRLRAIADSLECKSGLRLDDPDLLTLKRLLVVKAVALESEAASDASTLARKTNTD